MKERLEEANLPAKTAVTGLMPEWSAPVLSTVHARNSARKDACTAEWSFLDCHPCLDQYVVLGVSVVTLHATYVCDNNRQLMA